MTEFSVSTFGCKVNTYDSGLLQKKLTESGFRLSEQPQIHILNSCAVTAEATREALRQARRLKKQNPDGIVVLTGCAAQVDGALVDECPHVDLIIANSHKEDLPKLISERLGQIQVDKVHRANIFRNESLGLGGGVEAGHVRSYLKIQDGCNSFCSFCVIPFARGKSRSLPVPALLQRIRELRSQGVQEVVLTGVHIGDYCDQETPGGPYLLEDLVEQVLRMTEIPRLRLSSLEPIELTDKLLDLFNHPRLCAHVHLSLQSLSSPVLKAMRRQYSAEKVGWALQTIAERWPHAFVGLDVITGFPGESEELFKETYDRLQKWPWTRLHVFPYSEREGTRATQLPDSVPVPERRRRAKILRELSVERYDHHAVNQLGQRKDVLLIKALKSGEWQALSQDYWDVVVADVGQVEAGELLQVQIKGYQRAQSRMNGFLHAEVAR